MASFVKKGDIIRVAGGNTFIGNHGIALSDLSRYTSKVEIKFATHTRPFHLDASRLQVLRNVYQSNDLIGELRVFGAMQLLPKKDQKLTKPTHTPSQVEPAETEFDKQQKIRKRKAFWA